MIKEKTSRRRIQAIIFLVLFLLLELLLRLLGAKAGTWSGDLKIENDPEYIPRFSSDEMGINHLLRTNPLMIPGSQINRQGFRDTMDYTPQSVEALKKNTGKEVVMFIGDSYVEGCCPDNMSKTFPDVVNRTKKYAVLNMGVAGTDPLQYALVAKKYVPLLKPDRVLVAVYFGNDLVSASRKPTPGIPLLFPFKNNKWIYDIAPDMITGKTCYSFKDEKEAYQFYVEHYSLKGDNRNFFEKAISHSVIFSKIYLGLEQGLLYYKWTHAPDKARRPNDTLVVQSHLQSIKDLCDALKTPCLFVGIPEPTQAEDAQALTARYQPYFGNIPWLVPYNLTLKDYDGRSSANHFNNEGSRKYAVFLEQLLDRTGKNGNGFPK